MAVGSIKNEAPPVIQHASLTTSAQLTKRLNSMYPDVHQKKARNTSHNPPFSSQPPPFRLPSHSRSDVFMTPSSTPVRPLTRYVVPMNRSGYSTVSPAEERLRSLLRPQNRMMRPQSFRTPNARSVAKIEDVASASSNFSQFNSQSIFSNIDDAVEGSDLQRSASPVVFDHISSGPLLLPRTVATPSEKNGSNISFTVELLHVHKKYGRLPPEKIEDVIDKHKDEPNFAQEYKSAINKLSEHIGDLSPTEGNRGMNFWMNSKVVQVEKTYEKMLSQQPPQKLFDSISEPIQIHTEHSQLFQKTGSAWKTGWKTPTDLKTYPSDGLRCISKVLKYLLFELTNDPEDVLFFTVKWPSNQDLSLIPMPKDVYTFINDYIFNLVGYPLDIFEPDMNLSVFQRKYPRKFETWGSTILEQTDGLLRLRNDANTLRLLKIPRTSKILSDNRYKIITRTESGLKFEKMTREQKAKFKREFETRRKDLLTRMGNEDTPLEIVHPQGTYEYGEQAIVGTSGEEGEENEEYDENEGGDNSGEEFIDVLE